MGCITSKQAASVAASPVLEYSAPAAADNISGLIFVPSSKNPSGSLEIESKKEEEKSDDHHQNYRSSRELKKSKKGSSNGKSGSFSIKLGFSNQYVEAEQIAAGWPAWLSAAAGEAIHGWVPLRADSYEKLEKIGQGTYSSVFRAREVETGRMFALKKVRFDNFQPESIRFMAREIMILRRLDHPNIMKLEGVITSRLSSSIYLVFEYMEHDLAGLSSSPDIRFSESQIKCYMKQLLSGIEHCHQRGIMHRDIKASNILVNNEGILKLGDFGLANIVNSRNKQQLTSRVVTLWYRPPELLMGSTNYGVSVDLWSVGCVFAELLIGRPILKGRTEVEQLHKIFKLCGSPSEEYWRKAKLPHASMFKPQHPYESCLQERCKEYPTTAVNLIETFLSIEPYNRGTASSALMSEYFNTKPYACEPSSLPKYSPNKEIDAKHREETRRKKAGARMRDSGASRKPRRVRKTLQEQNFTKLPPKEEALDNTQFTRRNNGSIAHNHKGRGSGRREPLNSSFDAMSEISQVATVSQGDCRFTGPVQVTASSGFAWVKRRKEDAVSTLSEARCSSRSQISALDSSSVVSTRSAFEISNPGYHDSYGTANQSMKKQLNQFARPDSFDASDVLYHSQDFPMTLYQKDEAVSLSNDLGRGVGAEFSGPLLSQSRRIDELLRRNENHIRLAARRTRIDREK